MERHKTVTWIRGLEQTAMPNPEQTPHCRPPVIAAPEVLAVGKLYEVTHKAFGRFLARAVEPTVGWCGFVLIESNPELSRLGFSNGEYIELTAEFYRATPL